MRIKMQALFLTAFLAGLILALFCIDLGQNYMHGVMLANGGGMDTNNYMILLQESIRTYRELGIALLITGALGEIVIISRKLN